LRSYSPVEPKEEEREEAREKQQAKKQAAQQRSESAPDPRFMGGLEEDFVLDGALMVLDACAR
jgi:hypothetical protein